MYQSHVTTPGGVQSYCQHLAALTALTVTVEVYYSHMITSEGCVELLSASGSADSADSDSRGVQESHDHI